MNKLLRLALPLALSAAICPSVSEAQDTTAEDIEALFSAEETPQSPSGGEEKRGDSGGEDKPKKQQGEIKDLSDLAKLAPFDDVAVIQKRFLPKSQRFEVFGGLLGVINDAFFLGVGGGARFGYNFVERYGIEFVGWILDTSEKQVTEDLRVNRGVFTQSLITPESYYGVDFKWTPIYGKMSWRNRKITPFDLYFSLGGGLTGTNQQTSEPTLHLGTGQIFALSKSMAFRWDFSWNFFAAESQVAGNSSTSVFNNLFLTLGMSFFFPEATYR